MGSYSIQYTVTPANNPYTQGTWATSGTLFPGPPMPANRRYIQARNASGGPYSTKIAQFPFDVTTQIIVTGTDEDGTYTWDTLPAGFQIDTVNRVNLVNSIQWPTGLSAGFSSATTEIDGSWYFNPTGLYWAQPTGGTAAPLPHNFYNGLLQAWRQLSVYYQIDEFAKDHDGAPESYLYGPNNDGSGFAITGTCTIIPPPPNIQYFPLGGFSLGGAARVSILSDASGIYTLTVGLRHDELYQRAGTTATTVNVMIPDPHFKTGFIGG